MIKIKFLWPWLLALLLTIVMALYQRMSGPTYPVKATENLAGTKISYKFYRSWIQGEALPVRVTLGNDNHTARLHHRRFPLLANENWTIVTMKNNAGTFQGSIPGQPAAGKVVYKVEVMTPSGPLWLNNGKPVVARFRDKVPAWLLILHIIFMFAGLLLAFRTGMGALRRDGRWQKLVPWTLAVTVFGGLILGPLVQKYAFGAYWTGFPLGGDLTDSKTLFAVLAWLAAFFLRKKSRWWIVAATLLMIAVYLIPHSVIGSELNYETGKIGTAQEIRH
jgi:hypothetical protein